MENNNKNKRPLATIGTALLWMGWYGFNAGSALSAGSVASYAISATTIASCVGAITWSILSLIKYNHVHTIGNFLLLLLSLLSLFLLLLLLLLLLLTKKKAVLNGAIAGMAGITPVSGYIQSYWAFIIAVIIALGAWFGIILIKDKLKIDDALDVSSVHGITGIIGALSIGFVAQTSVNPNGPNGWFYGNFSQVYIQLVGVLVAIIWSALWTGIFLFLFRFSKFFKLTVEPEIERLGLDHYYHGDVAYVDLEAKGVHEYEEHDHDINYGRDDDDEKQKIITNDNPYSGYRI